MNTAVVRLHGPFLPSRLQRRLTDLFFKTEISAQQASADTYCAFPYPPILPMQFNLKGKPRCFR